MEEMKGGRHTHVRVLFCMQHLLASAAWSSKGSQGSRQATPQPSIDKLTYVT